MSNPSNPFDRFRQGIRPFRDAFQDNDSRQRGNTVPCPNANGTTIGTFQPFELLCGRNLGGGIIDESQQPNFLTCIDRCASFHPRCDSVSYDGTECRLRSGTGATESRISRRFDSAVGIFPVTQTESGCGALGLSTTSGSSRFDISCGFIINGNDIFQQHTADFDGCLKLCSQTAGCGAVSYDVKMDQGFNNCYLKRGNSDEGPLRLAGIDSAVVSKNAVALLSTAQGGVGVIPVPVPNPLTEASSTSSATPVITSSTQSSIAAPLTPTVLSDTAPSTTSISLSTTSLAATVTSSAITSLITQTSTSEGSTAILTSLSTSTRVSTLPLATATLADSNTTIVEGISSPAANLNKTPAWVAAPVLGSLAVIIIIIAVFFTLRRKQRSQTAMGESGTGASAMSLARINGWFQGWLPRRDYGGGRYRFRDDGHSRAAAYFESLWQLARGGGRGRAHDEKLRATEKGIGGSRSSSRQGYDGDDGPVPMYELRQGKIALRDSMNGLAQNKPILDEIPHLSQK